MGAVLLREPGRRPAAFGRYVRPGKGRTDRSHRDLLFQALFGIPRLRGAGLCALEGSAGQAAHWDKKQFGKADFCNGGVPACAVHDRDPKLQPLPLFPFLKGAASWKRKRQFCRKIRKNT